MSIEVLCIGHAAFDLSLFVDDFPTENSKCEIRELMEACGGPAANAAYLLSSWGVRCAFAGLVGDDAYGHRIRDDFLSAGTVATWLELRADHATPLSTILINRRNGSRTIINRKIPAAPFVPVFQIGPAPQVLLFDGHELPAALAALEAFPDAISILDAGSWREGTAALAGKVHYLAASERFALQATGLSNLHGEANRRECMARLRKRFAAPTIVVTLGENGLTVDDGTGFRHMPAFRVRAVDTTAAGDIWHGAFAYGVARDLPLWESLRLASMAAALSVQATGGRASIPPLHLVQNHLSQLS